MKKQTALEKTKELSRLELIEPIIKLLSDSSEAGKLVPVVSLTGQVKFPGLYPISSDATLEDVIYAGGGLKESANLSKGELSRIVKNNNGSVSVEHISFSLGQELGDEKSSALSIEPRDVINVFQKANWNENLTVELKGEVRYPGIYSVSEGETLLQVLKRAGGVTDTAAVDAAFFTRVALKRLERKQASEMARALSKELALKSVSSTLSSLNINEVQSLVANLSQIEGVGRLVIDLDGMLDGTATDITLEDGDIFYMPPKRQEINVVGEVQVAASHVYRSDWTVSKYIESSGGMRAQADEGRVYIVRANGLVDVPDLNSWFSVDEKENLMPGDTIVIPLDAGYTDRLTLWEKASSIFYQLSVGLVALGNVN